MRRVLGLFLLLALLSSVDLLEKGQYDDIRYLIDSALKAGMDKNIGRDFPSDCKKA